MKERLFTEYNIIDILFIFFNAVIYKDRSLFYLGLIILFYNSKIVCRVQFIAPNYKKCRRGYDSGTLRQENISKFR